jgi:FKBP-type peptidyl-prolyl cis-trans isomerase
MIHNHGDTIHPIIGNTISMHYVGKLYNDQKFDSSIDRNQPFDIKYKNQSLIPGFEEGLNLVGKGGKVTLFIPYYLGYGEKGVAVIPQYADLVFELDILYIK